MRANRSSGTAEMVAVWRALADRGYSRVPGFSDPFAERLLGARWRRMYERARRDLERPGRARSMERYEHVVLRVAALDRLLLDAVAGGARQVVVLGAGLDTRAWRLPALAETRVFEVDHPNTQREKRGRAAELPGPVGAHAYVAVDFAVDDLGARLDAAGHDPRVPTVWLWEGVVMYLRDPAVSSTLAAVAARSARESTLLLHYHTPDLGWSVGAFLRWLALSVLGEPQVGKRTPEQMARLVGDAGLLVERDLAVEDQAALVGAPAPTEKHTKVSRILVARKR